MKKDFRLLTAFTLAEVLLVLVIIGVISALTIPSLNQNMKKQEYVSALTKADSTLAQALTRVKTDFGPIGFGAMWRNSEEFWKAFTGNLNVIKVCQNGEAGCFTGGNIKKLDGSDGGTYDGQGYGVRTADGFSYLYKPGVDSVADLGLSTENAGGVIGTFVADVNGEKGPNTIGEDIYFFALVRGEGIIPAGSGSTTDCCYGQAGKSCAAKVLQEGKIDYSKCGGADGSGSSSSGGTSSSGSTSGGSSTGSSSGNAVTSSGGSSSGGSTSGSSGGSTSGSSTSGSSGGSTSGGSSTGSMSGGSSSSSSKGGSSGGGDLCKPGDHHTGDFTQCAKR